jgi:hypothetical protein
VQKEKLIQRLEVELHKAIEFFERLEDEQWVQEIYSNGDAWTAHQILAHFISVERAFQWLVADIVAGGSGAPEGFDIDQFNQREVRTLEKDTRASLLARFTEERQGTIEQVSRYQPDDLLKIGLHPWFGDIRVSEILKWLYLHNKLHLRDVRRSLAP